MHIIENGVAQSTLHLLKACLFIHFESGDHFITYEAIEVYRPFSLLLLLAMHKLHF